MPSRATRSEPHHQERNTVTMAKWKDEEVGIGHSTSDYNKDDTSTALLKTVNKSLTCQKLLFKLTV